MANKRKKTFTSSFLIGLFMLIGIALSIALVIWLGANQFLKEQVKYATYFDGSVEGLEPGSAVKYLGVPVGTITEVGVAPDGKLVEVIMQVDPSLVIADSLRVKSELAGIAGGKFLQLYFPSSDEMMNMHPEIDFKPEYRVIKSTPSQIEEITLAMREVIDNLNRLKVEEISQGTVDFLDVSTKFFSNDDLYKTVSQLSDASRSLSNVLRAADTSQIVDNLELSSYAIRNTADHLNILASDLKKRIDSLLFDERFNKTFDNIDSTMFTTRTTINSIGKRADIVLLGLAETLMQLRETNKQLRQSMRSLTDDPGRTLFTEPPPEEE